MVSRKERARSLRKHYNEKKARLIERYLTEKDFIALERTNEFFPNDYIYIAAARRVRKTKPALAARLNDFHYADVQHQRWAEGNWVDYHAKLAELENGAAPTELEAARHVIENEGGIEFKIFYCLRFSDKVQAPDA
ncbi:MAG: hypothetical protein ABIH92_02230 [Nanoarchaeota archaeon]